MRSYLKYSLNNGWIFISLQYPIESVASWASVRLSVRTFRKRSSLLTGTSHPSSDALWPTGTSVLWVPQTFPIQSIENYSPGHQSSVDVENCRSTIFIIRKIRVFLGPRNLINVRSFNFKMRYEINLNFSISIMIQDREKVLGFRHAIWQYSWPIAVL